MSGALSALREHLATIQDLEYAARILSWDQETYMPVKGAQARAKQLSTLKRLAHEQFAGDKTGDLLADLEEQFSDADNFARTLHRVTLRDYRRARCLPTQLVAEFSEAASMAQEAWKTAREQDSYATFAPHLATLVDLSRQKAEAYGFEETPYDALVEEYEPGMTTAKLTQLFDTVRAELVPFAARISEKPRPDTSFLQERFDPDTQLDFGLKVARDTGYDLARGRQDISEHPFSTSFSISDVRITTRVNPNHFNAAFFGTLHEAGHAIYEQGLSPELERTPLADGASLGMHESQSRLWENLLGRSLPFWEHYYPELQKRFSKQLHNVSRQDFVRGINRVEPSPIRVESDEVTYNLHIMLRFQLEQQLIEGALSIDELPEAWNTGMEEYVGVVPESAAEGVLQDVHWSMGAFGYFPTYALGNLMSVQIYREVEREIADLEEQIRAGQFGDLLAWLRRNIHRHGRAKTASEIIRDISGEDLAAQPWLRYVKAKFSRLYNL